MILWLILDGLGLDTRQAEGDYSDILLRRLRWRLLFYQPGLTSLRQEAFFVQRHDFISCFDGSRTAEGRYNRNGFIGPLYTLVSERSLT